MEKRHLTNPFPDYQPEQPVGVDNERVMNLICCYVDEILENTNPSTHSGSNRGDLYVGDAGIAYMFWKLSRSTACKDLYPALEHAQSYIRKAKSNALRYHKRSDERCAFLCGNAGIYAVSAVISNDSEKPKDLADDLEHFLTGFEACKPIKFSTYGCDELLVGRAGYLSGCYWLNSVLPEKAVSEGKIATICNVMYESGRQYAAENNMTTPLMYQYHGTEYLGAAHGLSSILHMLLQSSERLTREQMAYVKKAVDFYVALQDTEGNFPVALEDLQTGRDKRLVHWCHGAPGVIYLLVKAYNLFKNEKYLKSAELAADLVWKKGFLRKGPGICHGVSGNGYVFLILYRLTKEQKYLYRASKYMELLTNLEFKARARIPDRPFSLYEGVAGTVCYLIDLLHPETAYFPFMEVFN